MHETYWGLQRPAFENVPDPAFFCPLKGCREALEKLSYVVEYAKGGAVLTGEVGCGKSTLSRVLILQLEEQQYDVGLVINPSIPSEEFLHDVAVQLGLAPPAASRAPIVRALNEHLVANAQAGRKTVLILDEAHTIRDDAVYEDLRMLLNIQLNDRQLLTLILLGAPELNEIMMRKGALHQRLALRLHLAPLGDDETEFYVDFRIKKAGATRPLFTDEAIRAIARGTGGVPRKINNLCDLCLFEGSKRKASEVDSTLVKWALAYL